MAPLLLRFAWTSGSLDPPACYFFLEPEPLREPEPDVRRLPEASDNEPMTVDVILTLLDEMERAQARKVLDLARRLKPGLTAEDIRNPHDFPDLDDADWHFEDGQLTGIQAVRFAVRALLKESDGEAREEDREGQG